jgi:glycyl-tRNA synthetase beta chain
MVFEFPELQGVMGGIYARAEGEPEQVWQAIYHQYLPVGVEAEAPPSKEQLGAGRVTWAAVSLADKADTFVALTLAGERATGSRDPFGLRRQVQGSVRILMDLPELTGLAHEVSLESVLNQAAAGVPGASWEEARRAADAFVRERARYALEQRGVPIEIARAATSAGAMRPLRARRIAEALRVMRASDDFQALAVLFKRVKNIARELKEDRPLDRSVLVEPAEQALLAELDARRSRIEQAAAAHDYKKAFSEIALLRAPVDRFFTEVFVMADDLHIRSARLNLMAELRDLILDLADISEIIPQTE